MKDILKNYIGSSCEVKTLENDLLFLGKVRGVSDNLSLSIDIVSSDGSPLMGSKYGVPVKISIFKNTSNMMIIGGKVYMANSDFWRISNVSQYQNYERRGFFRVQANSDGFVSVEAEEGQEIDESMLCRAKAINVSLSGVLFTSPQKFSKYDILLLSSVRLADEKTPFTFRCQLVDDITETPKGEYAHRCKFLEMGQRESDRLCKAIFYMQRETIKKRKSYY